MEMRRRTKLSLITLLLVLLTICALAQENENQYRLTNGLIFVNEAPALGAESVSQDMNIEVNTVNAAQNAAIE